MPRTIVYVRSPMRRAHGIAVRSLVLSFVAAFLLALSTSGGILWERLSLGGTSTVVIVGCSMAATSWLLLLQTRRALSLAFCEHRGPHRWSVPLFAVGDHGSERVYHLRQDTVLAAQVLGAFAGGAIVYLVTRVGPYADMHWLSSRPALLVNDGIAAVSLIALVWSLATDFDTAIFVGVLLLLTFFDATGRHWSVDRAHQLFRVTVQHALVVQFAAISLSLVVFRGRLSEQTDGE